MAQTQPVIYDMPGTTATSINVRSEHLSHRLPPDNEKRATDMLLLYMVDYLEKKQYHETAAALKRESKVQKVPKLPVDSRHGLLWEWWACFWEIYSVRCIPNGTHSQVAKDYSENLYQQNVERYRQSGQPQIPGASGPSRPYVNGGPGHHPTPVNGHVPSTQYPMSLPGVQGVPMHISGNSSSNPTPLDNPTLQHLPRSINGRPYSGPLMATGSLGVQYPMHPGGPMPPRSMPNGAPPHSNPNPNARPQMAQHINSPQNQESYTSPRNHNLSEAPNPPAAEDAKMESVQKTPRTRTRAQKRPSEEESPPEGETPPMNKKKRRSPQGNVFPSPGLASAQPIGMPRPVPSGGFTNIPAQVKAGGPISIPPHPIPVNGGPPTLPTKVPSIGPPGSISAPIQNHLDAAAASHGHHAPVNPFFQQISENTMSTYGVIATPTPNPASEINGSISRPAIGTMNGPKGSMLPPPPPGPSTLPQTPTNAPKAINGLAPPSNPTMKDGSPKIDNVSPENTRPGSRPISSTPQPVPSAQTPTGIVSTSGGPSVMSAPSPVQLATPRQTSRPHSQSPNARPSTAEAGASTSTPALTQSVVIPRIQGHGALAAPNPTSTSTFMPTLSSLNAGPGTGELLPDEFFAKSIEFLMMGFQEPDFFFDSTPDPMTNT